MFLSVSISNQIRIKETKEVKKTLILMYLMSILRSKLSYLSDLQQNN